MAQDDRTPKGVFRVENAPRRRLARLNEGRWDPSLGVRTEIQIGVFGRGIRRAPGESWVYVYRDLAGVEYEERLPPEPAHPKRDQHPLFDGSFAALEDYAVEVLERYELPRPGAPGYFWEDGSGLLRWGYDRPAGFPDDLPFTGLWEPMASKFIDENTEAHPCCWEAAYASEFLDLNEQVRGERGSPSSFDAGLAIGQELGAILAEWRLGLIHGVKLLGLEFRSERSQLELNKRNAERAAAANNWQDTAVAIAKELYSNQANFSQAARLVLRRMKKGDPNFGVAEQTLADVLSRRRADWLCA